MPVVNGEKMACEPCIRGHRSTKCAHHDRILLRVRKPGRPLSNCPHKPGAKGCGCHRNVTAALPKHAACLCPPKSDQDSSTQASTPSPVKQEFEHSLVSAQKATAQTTAGGRGSGFDQFSSLNSTNFNVLNGSNGVPVSPASGVIGASPTATTTAAAMPSYPTNGGQTLPMGLYRPDSFSPFFTPSPMSSTMASPIPQPFISNVPAQQMPVAEPSNGAPVGSCCQPRASSAVEPPTNSPAQGTAQGTVPTNRMISMNGYQPLAMPQNGNGNGNGMYAQQLPREQFQQQQQQLPIGFPSQFGTYQYPLQQAQWQYNMSQKEQQMGMGQGAQGQQPWVAQNPAGVNPVPKNNNQFDHNCECGPGCQCVGCSVHPFNQQTQALIASAIRVMRDENGDEMMDETESTAGSSSQAAQSPSNGNAASTNDAGPNMSDDRYLWLNYDVEGLCGGDDLLCQCGDDCDCVGCTIHKNPPANRLQFDLDPALSAAWDSDKTGQWTLAEDKTQV